MRYAVVALAVLALSAASARADAPTTARPAPAQPAATPVAGNAEAGRRAFQEFVCYYCHGTEGQGSSAVVGPRIATTPRTLDSFLRYVRRPGGRMSAYSEAVVSDAVLTDIYAFLKSVPAPKKAADLPTLQRLRPR
ncbi:MAG: cytochrome c [Vicinamibacterales bacterium]